MQSGSHHNYKTATSQKPPQVAHQWTARLLIASEFMPHHTWHDTQQHNWCCLAKLSTSTKLVITRWTIPSHYHGKVGCLCAIIAFSLVRKTKGSIRINSASLLPCQSYSFFPILLGKLSEKCRGFFFFLTFSTSPVKNGPLGRVKMDVKHQSAFLSPAAPTKWS